MRSALVATLLVIVAAACGGPAKPPAVVATPAERSAPAPAAPVEPAQAVLEVRAGEPSDSLHIVVPAAHVEQRLLFFGHEFDCVVEPIRTGASFSVACDPREGSMTIVVEGSKLVVRKGDTSGASIAEMAIGGPIVLEPKIRHTGAPACAKPSAAQPVAFTVAVGRGEESGRVVQLRGALAKPLPIGSTIHEGLRCRGWVGRTGGKGVYICDAPDVKETWTLTADDARIAIVRSYGDADGSGTAAVGGLRSACGKRFALRTATPHKDRDWAPMGSPRCDALCFDAQDDCEQTCNVNLDGAAADECREKCRKPFDACMKKRCNQ